MNIFRRVRRCEIITLARHLEVADTDDIDRFLLAWFWYRPPSADLDPVWSLTEAARQMGKPDLIEAEAREIIQRSRHPGPISNADELGNYLRLGDAMRTELGIRTIGAQDLRKRGRTLRRKQRDRERHRLNRLKRGARPRAQSRSRTRPWETLGVSRRTWYRRQRVQDGTDGTNSSALCRPVAQIRPQSS